MEKAFVVAWCGEAKRDGAKACAIAGYTGDPESLQRQSWRLLRKPRIRAAIDRRIAKRVAGRDEILGELSEIATAPWRDFVQVKLDDEGQIVQATLNVDAKIRAGVEVLKVQGAYLDPLTRALGKIAELEVQRLLKVRKKQARRAKVKAALKRAEKRARLALPSPSEGIVDAEVVQEQPKVVQAQPAQRDVDK